MALSGRMFFSEDIEYSHVPKKQCPRFNLVFLQKEKILNSIIYHKFALELSGIKGDKATGLSLQDPYTLRVAIIMGNIQSCT